MSKEWWGGSPYGTSTSTTSTSSYSWDVSVSSLESALDTMRLQFSVKEQNYQKQQDALLKELNRLQTELYIYKGRMDCPFNIRITNAGDYIRGPKRK